MKLLTLAAGTLVYSIVDNGFIGNLVCLLGSLYLAIAFARMIRLI